MKEKSLRSKILVQGLIFATPFILSGFVADKIEAAEVNSVSEVQSSAVVSSIDNEATSVSSSDDSTSEVDATVESSAVEGQASAVEATSESNEPIVESSLKLEEATSNTASSSESVVESAENQVVAESQSVPADAISESSEIDAAVETTSEETAIAESEVATEATSEAAMSLFSTQSTSRVATTAASTSNAKTDVTRISGRDRYLNAVEISKAGWTQADTVLLTNGTTFADSLAGSSLSGAYDAPILFTKANQLPAETLAEIKRLKASEVVVLGGETSVPEAILQAIADAGVNVRRVDGSNRYFLAANIAKELKEDVKAPYEAFLASGEVASDALSIAPVAASRLTPIYLTKNNKLEQAVIDAIPLVSQWTVIGSNNTISDSVVNQMIALGAKIRRIEGQDRYEVNQNIISEYIDPSKTDTLYVASGEHFSDALPSAALAAKKGTGVLLVKNDNNTNIRKQKEFAVREENVDHLIILGGTPTISADTQTKLANTYIFLDPGHGGYESGAYYYGVAEKDINLSVANKVRKLLTDAGYIVYQSRLNDTAVELYDRPDIANNSYQDIFVSVHHNAMPGSSAGYVSGIETYYYEYTPGEEYLPKTTDKYVYREAINPERRDLSIELATFIHNAALEATGALDRGVRENDFVVNREAVMPSVLLELGYMSQWNEFSKLITDSYQNKLASAIAKGIDQYFA
ncbi:hypothetical protein EF384_04305 [Aerococcus agrisoli]|uniref:MurNAc-LAA domain-containing protein n=1 Tax=Aerococcus agrisoli TaxID=2487350 RepID=A0A3N4GNU3_9LACT|nr:cell wall-binding repeat-containing protein [Aerococcus agrisoli]RPA60791.1 hypothetical protein EF384_04305 [Aerococcus agrisoli]